MARHAATAYERRTYRLPGEQRDAAVVERTFHEEFPVGGAISDHLAGRCAFPDLAGGPRSWEGVEPHRPKIPIATPEARFDDELKSNLIQCPASQRIV